MFQQFQTPKHRMRNVLLAFGSSMFISYLIFHWMALHLQLNRSFSVGLSCLLSAMLVFGFVYIQEMQ